MYRASDSLSKDNLVGSHCDDQYESSAKRFGYRKSFTRQAFLDELFS